MTVLTSYLPSSISQWWTAAGVLAGGMAGWATHPALWVVAGPARWPGILLGTCMSESRWGAYVLGDEGQSVGPMQWHATNVGLVSAPTSTSDWRTSPWWSGYAAAVYFARRVVSDPVSALGARVPVLGAIVIRWAYRNARPMTTTRWSEARAQYATERDVWRSTGRPWHPLAVWMWLSSAGLVLVPAALLVLGVASPVALAIVAATAAALPVVALARSAT